MSSARMLAVTAALVGAAALGASLSDTSAASSPPPLRWAPIVQGFDQPTQVVTAPGDHRIFVLEKNGMVRIVDKGRVQNRPYLDLRSKVSTDGERGLLSMVFHPNFQKHPVFWVYYTAPNGDLVLARGWATKPTSRVANPTIRTVLRIPHRQESNHNGGQLVFGVDGMLYVGTGDGGGGGDIHDNARRTTTLLGKVLRLDVRHRCNGRRYCVPKDNPFVGRSGRDEIWLWGLRNPWRMAVDERTGALWVADVGQSSAEEVTLVPPEPTRRNLGWPCREGRSVYDPTRCTAGPRLAPRITIAHDAAESITGGFVYRGSRHPDLRGTYLFGDFVNTKIWAHRAGLTVRQNQSLGSGRYAGVTAFAETKAERVVAVTFDGTLWRLKKI